MVMDKVLNTVIAICVIFSAYSCGQKEQKPPVPLPKPDDKTVEVKYSELGSVKTIPIKINGVSIDAIYDTGCSGVHLSLHELETLAKNNKFDMDDFLGYSYSTIADGSNVVNGVMVLKDITIGNDKPIIIKNVDATVSLNGQAPVLIGNGVFDKVAAMEIDNVNKCIRFKPYK